VPTSSQLLVFSKTSFQAPKIFPRIPRAIYHSDDVTVGYVRGGDVLEIASVDPQARHGVLHAGSREIFATRAGAPRRVHSVP
jgi:hypothetical protein